MYIYADNAATTKISKSALDAMIKTNEEATEIHPAYIALDRRLRKFWNRRELI